jgi:hypothetical protein
MNSALPTDLDPSSSVLFLGSGFTRDALNIRNEGIPTGANLKSKLAEILGVSPSDYDLKVLAEELASSQTSNLPQLLYELFTVTRLHPDQTEVLNNKTSSLQGSGGLTRIALGAIENEARTFSGGRRG